MTARRLAPLIVCGLLLSGCTAREPSVHTVPSRASWSAIYKGRFISTDQETRRFRAWIWAESPDRLHVEVFGPMGGTRLSVDGGGGRLAVSLVQERVVFAGEAGSLELYPLFGVSMTLGETVSALTGTGRPEGLAVWRRDADAKGGLPVRLQIGSGAGVLELRRIQIQPVDGSVLPRLGTGEPQAGLEVRPLAELWESGKQVLLR